MKIVSLSTSVLLCGCLLGVSLLWTSLAAAQPPAIERSAAAWQQTGVIAAPEAKQAAAADARYAYAINNTQVARYDRKTGERLAISTGRAKHLNSGFLHKGILYCAHSNYPQLPEESQIMQVDLATMKLTPFHSFGQSRHGSLTVAVRHRQHWWCVFAKYGVANDQTVLVKFADDWQEQAVWRFPTTVVNDLGTYSISGGIWKDDEFWATGHDKQVLYRLAVPKSGTVLEHRATQATPFPGQGIAVDPHTGGLVGIHRKNRQIVFAELNP